MLIETLSTFPDMFTGYMGASIMKRAQEAGALEFRAHDLRDWTHDKHRTTDDEIYGGGSGLLMKPEPIFEALDELLGIAPAAHDAAAAATADSVPAAAAAVAAAAADDATPMATVIFTAPIGETFTQAIAQELSQEEHIIFVCGHYEGFDERCYSRATRILSIGDYVLTGGELPAMVMTDAIVRLLPGVLGDAYSAFDESFSYDNDGLLEYPQYTRPASYRGMDVPEVLLSGDHGRIAAWRAEQARLRTEQVRPDLLG